jgi:S-adenosylmethionine hydrolase
MIITLTTDFGLRDSFAGTMKGVILRINPRVQIIDLTHGIAAGHVRGGAFSLMTAAPFFPAGTIHVAVIDPGVGSTRKAIAIRTRQAILIGPDNGVLSWAVREQDPLEIRSLENPELFLPKVSSTFHGRDVFAPAAAWLSDKREFRELGPELDNFQRLSWPEPTRFHHGWKTEVIHIDTYGNAITAFPAARAHHAEFVVLRGDVRIPFQRFYGAVSPGDPLAVIGSSGFVEIAVNQGNAANQLSLRTGSEVIIM